ncbi:transcriptional regulator [Pseudomonas resinovorans]|uniref:Transcriptional regulator n=1 Tax=Metapseudomonas resinovorans TaxID=53412 RepID=A0ABT4Y7D2_METRE|nr:transcriptional regulator [Pseudomonas resinovorans]MDA8484611.1 transcriptional regulator [Pseudomonas resinovorans]
MKLTRSRSLLERTKRDPALARALLAESSVLILQGEAASARLILRNLVNATLGFEGLALATGQPNKSLHRMLSARGNPGMDNLSSIIAAIAQNLGVSLQARSLQAP